MTTDRRSPWRAHGQPKTPSQAWGSTLPSTPAHSVLVALHALLIHVGATGDVLKLAEHHLHLIAVLTHKPDGVARHLRAQALRDFAEAKVKNQTAGRMYEDLLAEADRIECGQ